MRLLITICLFLLIGAQNCRALDCSRLVSLAPSVTEVVFALGLQNNLVGVSKYCLFPPEARLIAKVGGFLDPSYEALARLEPTLVLGLFEHREQLTEIEKLDIKTLSLEHRSVGGILASIHSLGEVCGRQKTAEVTLSGLRARLQRLTDKALEGPKVRALVVIGGGSREGSLKNLWISGKDGYYSELLELAGGTNVYKGNSTSVPALSAEGILMLNPEIVIEIVPDRVVSKQEEQKIKRVWQEQHEILPIAANKVYVLSGQHVSIPGPRFILLLEELLKIVQEAKNFA